MRAFAPNGAAIVATRDRIPGEALITEGSFQRAAIGGIDFEYAGETKLDWDGQETAKHDGQRLFLDEDGEEWRENQIVLEDAGEAPAVQEAERGCAVSLYANGRFERWSLLSSFLVDNPTLSSEALQEMFAAFADGRLWETGGGAAPLFGVKLYEIGDEDRDFNSDDPADHGAY